MCPRPARADAYKKTEIGPSIFDLSMDILHITENPRSSPYPLHIVAAARISIHRSIRTSPHGLAQGSRCIAGQGEERGRHYYFPRHRSWGELGEKIGNDRLWSKVSAIIFNISYRWSMTPTGSIGNTCPVLKCTIELSVYRSTCRYHTLQKILIHTVHTDYSYMTHMLLAG